MSAATLADGIIGFGFHIRGIQRKPGGWRLPLTNIIMGPPLFAPVLFGTAAYLGFIASYLRPEEASPLAQRAGTGYTGWRRELNEGSFRSTCAQWPQSGRCVQAPKRGTRTTRAGFGFGLRWTPVILSPIQFAACVGSIYSKGVAQKLLPASSVSDDGEWRDGLFLSRKGNQTPQRRAQTLALQRSLRAADFCAAVVFGVRAARRFGVRFTEGES